MKFKERKRKQAAAENFVWPREILRGRVLPVLFSDLFSKILKNVK